jgi:hypothetical protein
VRGFDTVSVCLSKGLGTPAGTVLVGRRDLIDRAPRVRKMLGGTMRQVGILARRGLYALEHNVDRLAEDHANAQRLAQGPGRAGLKVDPVQTNMVFAAVPGGFVRAARAPPPVQRRHRAGGPAPAPRHAPRRRPLASRARRRGLLPVLQGPHRNRSRIRNATPSAARGDARRMLGLAAHAQTPRNPRLHRRSTPRSPRSRRACDARRPAPAARRRPGGAPGHRGGDRARPNSSPAYALRGTIRMTLGSAPEAIADFTRAIQLTPE